MRLSTGRLTFAAALALLSFGPPAHAADGDLDPTFWSHGRVTLGATSDTGIGGLATRTTGQMVVGYTLPGEGHAYWRSVGDSTWGSTCRVAAGPVSPAVKTHVLDVVFDASGRLLVLALIDTFLLDGASATALFAYEYPYCRLDREFGTDGIFYLPFEFSSLTSYAARITTMSNGKILIAGGEGVYDAQDVFHTYSRVIRVEADGDLDLTFSGDGVAYGAEPWNGIDLAAATNGHIVMAVRNMGFGDDDFRLHEFDGDGNFLSETAVAFDLGGTNIDTARAITATPDGKVVVVGTAAGAGPVGSSSAAIAILAWDAQGVLALHPGFSTDGKLAFAFGGTDENRLYDVIVQGTNRIVVAGAARAGSGDFAMAVARLTFGGTFDKTFYAPGKGRKLVDFDKGSPYHDLAMYLALQQGRVVLGGKVDVAANDHSVGLARLENQ